MVKGCAKKVPAKFGEESSVKGDGLYIGCLSQWAEVGRENSNMQELFARPCIHKITNKKHRKRFCMDAFFN